MQLTWRDHAGHDELHPDIPDTRGEQTILIQQNHWERLRLMGAGGRRAPNKYTNMPKVYKGHRDRELDFIKPGWGGKYPLE